MTKYGNVKENDKFLVEFSHFSKRRYYIGTVTRVTNTQFIISYNDSSETRIIKSDGSVYGEGSRAGLYHHVQPYNPEKHDSIINEQPLTVQTEKNLKAENERLRSALENALLWTDEENDVSDWRDKARQALKGE